MLVQSLFGSRFCLENRQCILDSVKTFLLNMYLTIVLGWFVTKAAVIEEDNFICTDLKSKVIILGVAHRIKPYPLVAVSVSRINLLFMFDVWTFEQTIYFLAISSNECPLKRVPRINLLLIFDVWTFEQTIYFLIELISN